jgi:hypothetical protein
MSSRFFPINAHDHQYHVQQGTAEFELEIGILTFICSTFINGNNDGYNFYPTNWNPCGGKEKV